MDRRERRRRERERKKLEEKIKKESSQERKEHKESLPPLRRALLFSQRTLSGTKVVWGLVVWVLTVAAAYALFHPHVSVEPGLLLNPKNPYSTQFTVTNENAILNVHDLDCVCWPRRMVSGNGFSVLSPMPLAKVHHVIPVLNPNTSSTVDCPDIIGGIGAGSGEVIEAELEIDISYKQYLWPFIRNERYPFRAITDAQRSVHWIHITPAEEKPIFTK
jgi:hypothetical protein